MSYRDKRIEVKCFSYYHPWNEKWGISKARSFSIAPSNSAYESEKWNENRKERQNDIYVFCLNTGGTAKESNPLNLNNWIFYADPTALINKNCGPRQKTLSLGRIRQMDGGCSYVDIRRRVDAIIDGMGR